MGWFFKSDMERAEELRRNRQIAEGDALREQERHKAERERRLEQLDTDLCNLLERSHRAPIMGLSAWLDTDTFFGVDRRRPGSYSRAKEHLMRLVRDMTEPKDKACQEEPKKKGKR